MSRRYAAVLVSLAVTLPGCSDALAPTNDSLTDPAQPAFDHEPGSGDVLAYVANLSSDDVVVIDVATRTILGSPISVRAASGIDVTPDGSRVFVTQQTEGLVSVIDVATNTFVGDPIPVGSTPLDVAVTPDGSRAFVSGSETTVIDVQTLATAQFAEPPSTSALALTPDGSRLYMTHFSRSLSALVLPADTLIPVTIGLDTRGDGIAITPDGTRAYVTNTDGTVIEVDVVDHQRVGAPIPVSTLTRGIAITPDGTRAYVTNPLRDDVSVIDLATNQVIIPSIPVGVFPQQIAITPDGSEAWVTLGNNDATSGVVVIDLATSTLSGPKIPSGIGSTGIVFVHADGAQPPGEDPCTVDVTLTTQAEVDAFNCTQVDGDLWIGPSTDIQDLHPLSALERVRGAFVVVDNQALTTLRGLSSLESARDLVVADNPALASMEELSAMQTVGDLMIVGRNPVLRSLTMRDLEAAPQIEISRNGALEELGFPALTAAPSIFISEHTALNQITMPLLGSAASQLWIEGNDPLTDIDLSSLEHAGFVRIAENRSLPDLDGLSALRTLGLVEIVGNVSLEHVDGLNGVTSIEATLFVADNVGLNNLDGLSSLTSIGDGLFVRGNANLSKCACGLFRVLESGGVTGVVVIENNAPGCNDPAELTEEACAACMAVPLPDLLDAMEEDGRLRTSHARALRNKLRSAEAHVMRGRLGVALTKLDALVRQVGNFERAGHLSAEDAAALIEAVEVLRTAWTVGEGAEA